MYYQKRNYIKHVLLILPLFYLGCKNPNKNEVKFLQVNANWEKSITSLIYYYEKNVQEIFYHDIDNDDNDELFLVSNKYQRSTYSLLRLVNPQRPYFNLAFPGEILTPIDFYDYYNTGKQQIILIAKTGPQTLDIFINSAEGECLDTLDFLNYSSIPTELIWNPEIAFYEHIDINHDKKTDLLLGLNSNHSIFPSGIFAIDISNRKILWYFPTFNINNLIIDDFNDDFKFEIVASSIAQNKDINVSNMHGTKSWIFGLNEKGEINKKPILLEGSNSQVEIIKGNNGIIVFYSSNSSKVRSASYLLDYNEFTLIKAYTLLADHGYSGKPHFIQIPNKERMIIIHGTHKLIYGFDELGMEKLIKFHKKEMSFSVEDVSDINYDGEAEVILNSPSKGMYILNSDLDVTYYFPSGFFYQWRNNGINNPKSIIALSRRVAKPGATYEISLTKKIPEFSYSILVVITATVSLFIFGLYFLIKMIISKIILFNRLFEQCDSAVILISRKNKVKKINFQFQKTFDDILIQNIPDKLESIFFDEKYRQLTEFIAESITSKKQKELNWIRNQNEYLVFSTPIRYGFLNWGMLVEFNNITDKVRGERNSLWGSIAQKVAHDVKTPLGTILLAIENMQKTYRNHNLNIEKKLDGFVDSAKEEIEEIRNLAKALMILAKVGEPECKPVKLELLLENVLSRYNIHFKNGIKLKKDYAENLPDAWIDENEIKIVLDNIIANSLAAMNESGTLLISLQQMHDLQESTHENDKILLEISDSGVGISKDDIEKIFDPYFSKTENGTGLGMTIVKKIIENHKGKINIHSREGIGTTIGITLNTVPQIPTTDSEETEGIEKDHGPDINH